MAKKTIDGMESLRNKLGAGDFIKLAIENSYFFSEEIVAKRQADLNDQFQRGEALPARNTKKSTPNDDYWQADGCYCEGNVRIPIYKDSDGNRKVRSLINKETGYVVANGKNSDLINYVISHIWGRAFSPCYFTSFWNIVLIPAWANSLMDKDAPAGTLESQFQSTIKQICCELYKGVNKRIGSYKPKLQVNKNDVVHGSYTINLLQKKAQKVGQNPLPYTIII